MCIVHPYCFKSHVRTAAPRLLFLTIHQKLDCFHWFRCFDRPCSLVVALLKSLLCFILSMVIVADAVVKKCWLIILTHGILSHTGYSAHVGSAVAHGKGLRHARVRRCPHLEIILQNPLLLFVDLVLFINGFNYENII